LTDRDKDQCVKWDLSYALSVHNLMHRGSSLIDRLV